jgi:hypothetical protein
MTALEHPMIGKWRNTEMEVRDSDFIDLIGPGYIQSIQKAVASLSLAQSRAAWTSTKGKPASALIASANMLPMNVHADITSTSLGAARRQR